MTLLRRSIRVPGMSERRKDEYGTAPVPDGAQVGNVVCSSPILGRDPETGLLPERPDEQALVMFNNIRRFMEQAGATVEQIVQVTLLVQNQEHHASVNKAWRAMFPDPANRPARVVLYHQRDKGGSSVSSGPLFEMTVLAVV